VSISPINFFKVSNPYNLGTCSATWSGERADGQDYLQVFFALGIYFIFDCEVQAHAHVFHYRIGVGQSECL